MSGCDKKIIYVGSSTGKYQSLRTRLRDHFCAMDTLKRNIIGEVCQQQAYKVVIPYYMNPYLWHKDVEVVILTRPALTTNTGQQTVDMDQLLANLPSLQQFSQQIKSLSISDIEKILIYLLDPPLNKKDSGQLSINAPSLQNYIENNRTQIKQDVLNSLCGKGWDIATFVKNIGSLRGKKGKGIYIIKHSFEPQQLTSNSHVAQYTNDFCNLCKT